LRHKQYLWRDLDIPVSPVFRAGSSRYAITALLQPIEESLKWKPSS
jgi:hypothetical protein